MRQMMHRRGYTLLGLTLLLVVTGSALASQLMPRVAPWFGVADVEGAAADVLNKGGDSQAKPEAKASPAKKPGDTDAPSEKKPVPIITSGKTDPVKDTSVKDVGMKDTGVKEQPAPVPDSPVTVAPPSPPVSVNLPRRVVWTYWARWGDDEAPVRSLNRALGSFNVFSPYWFTVMPDGSISARESGHAELIQRVEAAGAKTLIMVNNYGEGMLTDLFARQRAAENILSLVRSYGVAGVNIDFERLSPARKDDLTAFVAAVADKLHPEGYLVTIAVGPKNSDSSHENDAAMAYDYAALGRLTDLVILMTYDQHGTFSEPGPVASLPWVQGIVEYAVSRIPAEKLLLGIATYGYEWDDKNNARPVRVPDALQLSRTAGVEVQWDEASAEARFEYTDASGGRHNLWLQTNDALVARASLADRYGLRGLAIWSMGQEDENAWSLVRSWLHR